MKSEKSPEELLKDNEEWLKDNEVKIQKLISLQARGGTLLAKDKKFLAEVEEMKKKVSATKNIHSVTSSTIIDESVLSESDLKHNLHNLEENIKDYQSAFASATNNTSAEQKYYNYLKTALQDLVIKHKDMLLNAIGVTKDQNELHAFCVKLENYDGDVLKYVTNLNVPKSEGTLLGIVEYLQHNNKFNPNYACQEHFPIAAYAVKYNMPGLFKKIIGSHDFKADFTVQDNTGKTCPLYEYVENQQNSCLKILDNSGLITQFRDINTRVNKWCTDLDSSNWNLAFESFKELMKDPAFDPNITVIGDHSLIIFVSKYLRKEDLTLKLLQHEKIVLNAKIVQEIFNIHSQNVDIIKALFKCTGFDPNIKIASLFLPPVSCLEYLNGIAPDLVGEFLRQCHSKINLDNRTLSKIVKDSYVKGWINAEVLKKCLLKNFDFNVITSIDQDVKMIILAGLLHDSNLNDSEAKKLTKLFVKDINILEQNKNLSAVKVIFNQPEIYEPILQQLINDVKIGIQSTVNQYFAAMNEEQQQLILAEVIKPLTLFFTAGNISINNSLHGKQIGEYFPYPPDAQLRERYLYSEIHQYLFNHGYIPKNDEIQPFRNDKIKVGSHGASSGISDKLNDPSLHAQANYICIARQQLNSPNKEKISNARKGFEKRIAELSAICNKSDDEIWNSSDKVLRLLLNLSQAEKYDMFFDWQRQNTYIPSPQDQGYKLFIKNIHDNIDKKFHDTSSSNLLKSSKIKAVKTIIEFVYIMTSQDTWMKKNPYPEIDTYGSEATEFAQAKGTTFDDLIGLNMLLIDQQLDKDNGFKLLIDNLFSSATAYGQDLQNTSCTYGIYQRLGGLLGVIDTKISDQYCILKNSVKNLINDVNVENITDLMVNELLELAKTDEDIKNFLSLKKTVFLPNGLQDVEERVSDQALSKVNQCFLKHVKTIFSDYNRLPLKSEVAYIIQRLLKHDGGYEEVKRLQQENLNNIDTALSQEDSDKQNVEKIEGQKQQIAPNDSNLEALKDDILEHFSIRKFLIPENIDRQLSDKEQELSKLYDKALNKKQTLEKLTKLKNNCKFTAQVTINNKKLEVSAPSQKILDEYVTLANMNNMERYLNKVKSARFKELMTVIFDSTREKELSDALETLEKRLESEVKHNLDLKNIVLKNILNNKDAKELYYINKAKNLKQPKYENNSQEYYKSLKTITLEQVKNHHQEILTNKNDKYGTKEDAESIALRFLEMIDTYVSIEDLNANNYVQVQLLKYNAIISNVHGVNAGLNLLKHCVEHDNVPQGQYQDFIKNNIRIGDRDQVINCLKSLGKHFVPQKFNNLVGYVNTHIFTVEYDKIKNAELDLMGDHH